MTIEKVKELYDATPFRPFTIHLAAGHAIPVYHRDFILAVPSGRTLVVVQPDDSMNIIDLLLVTDVELKPGRNGVRKKK